MADNDPLGLCSRRTLTALLAACLTQAPPIRALAQALPAVPQPDTLTASRDPYARMSVPVMINGRGPFLFVVDTGSNRTVVCDRLALELGLPEGPQVQVQSAVGPARAVTARIDSLQVGVRTLTRLRAPVFQEEHLGAEGILGIDALAGQSILMDFKAGVMIVTPSSRADDDPADIVVKARNRYGQLLLVDSTVGGVDLYVIIDTGGELTIGNLELQRMLQRRRRDQETVTTKVIGVSGESAAVEMTGLPPVKMGGVTVRNATIAYADLHAFTYFGLDKRPAMLLGMNILRNFKRVSIDFKARQVRFNLTDA